MTVPATLPGRSSVAVFHRLVANTLLAGVTNNLLWFALTFWVYLETRSVIASSVIGGGYMLIVAGSGVLFGTFVDRHRRKTSMLVSTGLSLASYLAALAVYVLSPADSLRSLGSPSFWLLTAAVLFGAVAGNLRGLALSTTVTLLVPEEGHAKANGLIGAVNGVGFALTSVFSGLAIGVLGFGWTLTIAIGLTLLTSVHLLSIRMEEPAPGAQSGSAAVFDLRGAVDVVRRVPGLPALLLFSTFNNFVGGVFMALVDPYGLTLVSVEMWGIVLAATSSGFLIGGLLVARRGLGKRPLRTLFLANLVMWTITVLFPLRSSIVLLAVGFLVYMILIPVAEAAEQTTLQRVIPFADQGKAFGLSQSLETAAAPITAFLIGPLAEAWVIPFMTDGAGAASVGSWFGTGPDRGMALIFIAAGVIGLIVTVAALRSRAYRRLSAQFEIGAAAGEDEGVEGDELVPVAA